VNSSGRIELENKDEIRKRLGRSPDRADSLVMASWQYHPQRTGPAEVYRW